MLSSEKQILEEIESPNQNYTAVENIGLNIISDPKLIPNGLNQINHSNVNQNTNFNNNTNSINNDNSNQEAQAIAEEVVAEAQAVAQAVAEAQAKEEEVDNMVLQSSNNNTYASELLAQYSKNNNRSPQVSPPEEIKKPKFWQEIMTLFPLSIVILLLIFIILLIVCVGFKN
jgi:ABC-type Na+ efflux pump permease subunit